MNCTVCSTDHMKADNAHVGEHGLFWLEWPDGKHSTRWRLFCNIMDKKYEWHDEWMPISYCPKCGRKLD